MMTLTGMRIPKPSAFAGALLGISMLLLLRRYPGIFHDSILYMGQGLMQRWPDIFGRDLFFAHGSQASYTILPWLLGKAFGLASPALVMRAGAFASMLLFAASSWIALRTLLPERQRYWAWLSTLCLPPIYGVVHIFSYNEPFLTSRPLAESCCLLAIACLVSKRWVWAGACVTMAALLHPLQAIAGVAILWVWLVMQDRRWLHGLWMVLPVVGFALVGMKPFDGLLQRADDGWFKELTYSRQVFVTLWSINDFKALGLDALVLVSGWRLLRGNFGCWCLAALVGASLGLAASLVLVDVFHLVLPIGLQLWRVLWLTHFIALAAMGALLWHYIRNKQLVPALLLSLTALLAWGETDWGWAFLALMYLGWPVAPEASRLRLQRLLTWIFGFAIVLLFYNHASNEIHWFIEANSRMDLYPLDRRLLVFPALSLGLPLLVVIAWDHCSKRVQRWLLVGALLPFVLLSLRLWDARDSTQLTMESAAFRPDIFGTTIPEHAQVYWEPESLVASWLVLHRASYFSPGQLAGQMFNRDTSEDGLQRENRLMPLMRESLVCQSDKLEPAQRARCHISRRSLRQACEPNTSRPPDYIVLPYPQPQPDIGRWVIIDPITGSPAVTFRLYRCDLLLQFLATSPAPPMVTKSMPHHTR